MTLRFEGSLLLGATLCLAGCSDEVYEEPERESATSSSVARCQTSACLYRALGRDLDTVDQGELDYWTPMIAKYGYDATLATALDAAAVGATLWGSDFTRYINTTKDVAAAKAVWTSFGIDCDYERKSCAAKPTRSATNLYIDIHRKLRTVPAEDLTWWSTQIETYGYDTCLELARAYVAAASARLHRDAVSFINESRDPGAASSEVAALGIACDFATKTCQ